MHPNQLRAILIYLITSPQHEYLRAILTPQKHRRPQKSRTKLNFLLSTLYPNGINKLLSLHSFIHKFMSPYFHQKPNFCSTHPPTQHHCFFRYYVESQLSIFARFVLEILNAVTLNLCSATFKCVSLIPKL